MDVSVPVGVALVIAALLAGCGGSGVTAADLEQQLSDIIHKRDGSTLEHATCVKHDGNTFRCSGDLRASRKAAENAVGSIDTSDWTERDWRVIERDNSGPLTLDVTVGDDGRWVSAPVN